MITKAKTVDEWFTKIDGDRATPLSKIRKMILKMAPKVEESLQYGMPTYAVGDHPIASFNSQKNYMSLYICDVDIVKAYEKELEHLDVGKSCIRFKEIGDLPPCTVEAMLKEAATPCKPKSSPKKSHTVPK